MQLKKVFAVAALAGAALGAAPAQAEAFFPTAQDYLQSQGYDPAIAAEVAGDDVRIRVITPEGLAGLKRAVTAMNDPLTQRPYGGALFAINEAEKADPASFPSLKNIFSGIMALPERLVKDDAADCYVQGIGPRADIKEFLANVSTIPVEALTRQGLSEKEFRLFVLLHEMRHCYKVKDGDREQFHREYESDWYAAKIIARVFNKPELIETVMKMRAPNVGKYMTSLYVDQMRQGKEPITQAEAYEASMAVRRLADQRLRESDMLLPFWEVQYRTISEVLKEQGDRLPPLQKRWAELFIGAYDTFAPEVKKAQALTIN